MINFGELELRVNEKYSFVGIEKTSENLIFHIPKGFLQSDINLLNNFDSKRDLFFRLYRVLNVFKQTCIEKNLFDKGVVSKVNDRDGVLEDDIGSKITPDNNSKNIFYSKIDALARILDAYDELKILGLINRLGKSEKFVYSKLHRFLDKAIFLNNGAIYIDFMDIPRQEIHFEATDIVAIYCYILTEIQQQLKQDIRVEINALAERFREKYLGSEYSLFSDKYYAQVISSLKDALDIIDNYTPIKDSDYWDFYDAIKEFLFGELDNSVEGAIWGFSNFHYVWEAMCLTHLSKVIEPAYILYLDDKFISNKVSNKLNSCDKLINMSNIFIVNNNQVFPDAVIITNQAIISDIENNQTLDTYQLIKDNWDDYGYRTCFYHKLSEREIKIAYADQHTNDHTFNKLQKFCKTNGNEIVINSLPDKFYSFWNIPDEIGIEEIRMIVRLNHLFFAAIKKGFLSFNNFYQNFSSLPDVFQSSLLRNFSNSKQEMNILYNKIVNQPLLQPCFRIIDIKYSTSSYYTNPDNIEEIKSRSIRKQFVYEYLIQKHLEGTNSIFKEWDIKSEFWLPIYSSKPKLLTPGPKYLDDYVKLTGVNIMTVIDSYLETEET